MLGVFWCRGSESPWFLVNDDASASSRVKDGVKGAARRPRARLTAARVRWN